MVLREPGGNCPSRLLILFLQNTQFLITNFFCRAASYNKKNLWDGHSYSRPQKLRLRTPSDPVDYPPHPRTPAPRKKSRGFIFFKRTFAFPALRMSTF